MRPSSLVRRLALPTLASASALLIGLSPSAQAQTLENRYSFNQPANSTVVVDSVGGQDGTLEGDAYLDGSSLQLDGTSGTYANLPANLLSNYTQVTVEFWFDMSPNNANWTRVYFFGSINETTKSSGEDYCPMAPGNYQNLDMLSSTGTDAYANNPGGLLGLTNVHVTVVVDPVNNNMYYYNGVAVVSTLHGPVSPFSSIVDTYDVIGASPAAADPYLNGAIHEFRVYSGVLSAQQVALNDATGPRTIVTSPGAITSISLTSPSNPLLVNQTSQEVVTGTFNNVTNLNLVAYGGVSFTSGNPSILTVTTNGVVKAIATGSTTLVASYGGMSATNTLTISILPATMTHRYSFTSDASDSIGGANGTANGNAQFVNGQVVLDGSAGTYVSLPGGIINIATNAAATFEMWTSIGAISEWSHLFEFGAQGASNIYCAPRADAFGYHEFGLSEGFGGGQTLSWAHGWSNITLHITGVVDPTTGTLAVYTNGVLMQAHYNDTAPLSNIATNLAALGQSSYGDPEAICSIDEFRIYTGALSPAQVAMSDLSGPNSTNFNPGALVSIAIGSSNYPAFTTAIPPNILATYANLTNFNMLPNLMANEFGLVVSSSNPNIISVNSQNMLTTGRPGTVTLTATYQGKTGSATVRVDNQAALTHRYSFTNDASDSVGGANGTLEGNASTSGGMVQLDGGTSNYVSLPGGLLGTYRSATMDVWATFSSAQGPWTRVFEFADLTFGGNPPAENELYFGPSWGNPPSSSEMSFGVPDGGGSPGSAPSLVGETVHITCLVADGSLDVYTNGVHFFSSGGISAPVNQAGNFGSWIGFSPYGDPGITGSVDEYRIYQGRLSPEEIEAEDILGPNTTLATTNAMLSVSASGGNIVLTWPLVDAGFAVETKTSLNPGTPWTTLTNAPTLVNSNEWELIVPNSGGDMYYQLIR